MRSNLDATAGPSAFRESRLRLQTSIRLRWFAVLGQLIAIGVVYFGLGFEMPIAYCLMFIALSAWLNVYLRIRYTSLSAMSVRTSALLITYDLAQLTALFYLTGGIENPFVFLIIAPVIVSAATLPSRETISIGAFAAVASIFLVELHWPLPWNSQSGIGLPHLYKLGILAAVLTSMTFLAIYAWRLSREARLMSAALAATEVVLGREQKLHALDGLAAAAAHELGTPLSTIAVVTKELEREIDQGSGRIDAAFAEDIRLLRTQALRCREILQKLSRQPSEHDPMHATVSVTQLIDEAARPYRQLARRIVVDAAAADGTSARTAVAEPIGERRPGVIYGLGNLIENASDYAASEVRVVARWDASEVFVAIEDDGPGIPPEMLEALGEPYVTTRGGQGPKAGGRTGDRESSGLGLGFFIAKTLLERSGATVAFGNRAVGSGAIVEVRWPRDAFEGASGSAADWS